MSSAQHPPAIHSAGAGLPRAPGRAASLMKDTVCRKMPTFHLKHGLVKPKIELGRALADLEAAAVRRGLSRALYTPAERCEWCNNPTAPMDPNKVLWGSTGGACASPVPTPVRKQGLLRLESCPGTQAKGCKGLSKRCFAPEPWLTHACGAEAKGRAQELHHRSSWQRTPAAPLRSAIPPPPQNPLLAFPPVLQTKTDLQSNGGRVSLNDSRGL